jgi:hypothetical protein
MLCYRVFQVFDPWDSLTLEKSLHPRNSRIQTSRLKVLFTIEWM